MKVHLLDPDRDFDWEAGPPAGHEDLTQDLELNTLLDAMAAGDKFLREVSAKVLLASLDDPDQIRYRQQVLADCLAQPGVIRDMYAVAAGAWKTRGTYGWAATAAATRTRHPTCPARSATWRPTSPGCGSSGRSPATTREHSALTGCGRCSPPCGTNWTTSTSRRSATTSGGCGSAPGC